MFSESQMFLLEKKKAERSKNENCYRVRYWALEDVFLKSSCILVSFNPSPSIGAFIGHSQSPSSKLRRGNPPFHLFREGGERRYFDCKRFGERKKREGEDALFCLMEGKKSFFLVVVVVGRVGLQMRQLEEELFLYSSFLGREFVGLASLFKGQEENWIFN